VDQSFSTRNLRRIWDRQTRKGKELTRLFPTVAAAFDVAREERRLLRRLRGDLALQPYDYAAVETLAENLMAIANAKLEFELMRASQKLIHEVETGTFRWGLVELVSKSPRRLFGIDSSPTSYFADKQLQRSIGSLIEPSRQSRQTIVYSLTRMLDNKLPKAVIKADVEKFYESINHDLLLKMVHESTLTRTSQGLITLLLSEYAAITGREEGIPMGVGISAKLAELYIGRIDHALSGSDGVMFYARYVDDIVYVHGLENQNPKNDDELLGMARRELDPLRLLLNQSKSEVFRSRNGTFPEFELLGYKVSRAKEMNVTLTDDRVAALEKRLSRTFDLWDDHDQTNTGRQGLLLNRLRFLTGNTRLSNNKRNAMVGIYFTNPHLTQLDVLDDLDVAMRARAAQSHFPPRLALQVQSLSFRKGFETRVMFRFTPLELKKIRGAWNG